MPQRRRHFAVLLLLSLGSCLFAQSAPYFPPANAVEWTTQDPTRAGFDTAALNRAVDFALANEYSGARDLRVAILEGFAREPYHEILGPTKKRGGPAGMILKNGYLVASWGDLDRVDMTFSVTKSYLSTVAGLALAEGLIRSVDDPVADYVWEGRHFESEHNRQITWRHLLTQSSDWSGTLWGGRDWADRPPRDGGLDDWQFRELQTPGAVFEYNDVRVNLLAYALLQVWRKPLPQVLKERVMDPIGASPTWRWFGYENSWVNVDGQWMQSVSGGGHSGGGLFISTRDHARFGLLFANRGRWAGREIFPASWITAATEPSDAERSYGFMWWLNDGAGSRHMPDVPESVYYAAGFGGNYIVVDTDQDLVIVTRWLEPGRMAEMVSRVRGALR